MGCYDFFGTTTDGSPLGCNAEVISSRHVRKSDHQIITVVLSVRLYEASLTGENIGSNLVSELRRWSLDLKKWRPCMMDRAENNRKGLKDIKKKTIYDPSLFPCLAHTFVLPGKEFKKLCNILHSFRKAFNTSIMFRGKLFNHIKLLVGFPPFIAVESVGILNGNKSTNSIKLVSSG